jgi:hypothetical protein
MFKLMIKFDSFLWKANAEGIICEGHHSQNVGLTFYTTLCYAASIEDFPTRRLYTTQKGHLFRGHHTHKAPQLPGLSLCSICFNKVIKGQASIEAKSIGGPV